MDAVSRSFLGIVLACVGGCASLTNPVADGIPVRRLPSELLAPSKEFEETIPLTALGQPPQAAYRLAPGDVLGIWIEGVLGSATQLPPLHVAPPVVTKDQRRHAPAVGVPVPVTDKGTIALPLLDPVVVQGLTLLEVQETLRKIYTQQKQILKEGNERILVSLLEPRTVKVVVLRQEASNFTPLFDVGTVVATGKRGTGQVVELKAGENDVLHALTETGGLPGIDAYNSVQVFRHGFQAEADARLMIDRYQKGASCTTTCFGGVKIPLRQKGCAEVRPEDVILQDGDVVFLEARDTEVYYTGGLLPSAEHVLPRDRDLDVIAAIAQSRGPLLNGAYGTNTLAGNLVQPGVGNPSPSLLIIVRKLPGGNQIPIKVDLNKAMVDRRERILVKPGDLLILQELPGEALARYVSNSLFNFTLSWQAIRSSTALGVLDVNAPQNIPGRIGVGTTYQR